MQLFLMRHGPAGHHADPQFPDDRLRPLTPEGRKKTRSAARGFRALGVELDLILTSPLARARQTAEVVADVFELPADHVQDTPHLEPGAGLKPLLEQLASEDPQSSVLLVGHEPDLSEMISELVAGDADALAICLKKAALCALNLDDVPPTQRAELCYLLQPRQLRALGHNHHKH